MKSVGQIRLLILFIVSDDFSDFNALFSIFKYCPKLIFRPYRSTTISYIVINILCVLNM